MLLKAIFELIRENLNIILLVTLIGILVYRNSIKSRKYYVCPNCKESFRTEHMKSRCCKVCGTPLKEKDDTKINDSAGDYND